MKAKVTFVLGAALGYVVGTRTGRRGYEKIKSQASDLWQSPRVQRTVADVEDFAREKIPAVGDVVGNVVGGAKHWIDDAAATTSHTGSHAAADVSSPSSDSPTSASPTPYTASPAGAEAADAGTDSPASGDERRDNNE
ncbi:YtxH domain-containing protein [Glaciihabitans sp. dw_435]|uniref:YtxH domain-containing protein n=1 Tax=Glaciihabitans sp. dw_435 TaxID=2720081 RepID=UPI001BD2E499|nr:YtxH domain-containing protein [Glaciihabitans sp. dw_435]